MSSASSFAMNRSPGPIFWSDGRQNAMTSTSVSVSRTRSLSRSPSSVRGRCRPGVSTSTSWASVRWTIPRIVCRVVCGRPDVIATFRPTSALVRVDLPAFGRPTTHTKPERKPGGLVEGPAVMRRLLGVGRSPARQEGQEELALQGEHLLLLLRLGVVEAEQVEDAVRGEEQELLGGRVAGRAGLLRRDL